MAPQVLSRVCHGTTHPEAWQRDRMTIQPALLRGYRRHKVRYADFPAIVPVQSSTAKPRAQEQTQPQSQSQSHTVRGTLVSGLTAADIMRLDIFEGSMYERVMVDVQTQGNRKNDNDNGNDNEMEKEKQMEEETGGQKYNNSSSNNKNKKINAAVFDSHADDDTFNGETVRVQTYVWAQPLHQLEPEEWNFEQFVRDRLHIWAGTSGKEDFEGSLFHMKNKIIFFKNKYLF